MGMIIVSVVVMGCFFYGYVIYANMRQGKHFRSEVRYEPQVIRLPENIEREKRRRHIR